MRIRFIRACLGAPLALLATPAFAADAPLRPDQIAFRGLYKELVETNTTFSAGSCALAADRMAARLTAAGFAPAQIARFAPDGRPKEGGLVLNWPGSDAKLPALLLLAHIDVVEARRADWTRDPFTLIEEGGFFYARGAADDKSQAAIFTDSLIRLRMVGAKPRRTLKLALTCGEEGAIGVVNGVEWLAKNRPDLIAAGFALNEGGGGRSAPDGGPLQLGVQVGEKSPRSWTVETTNAGGHSSIPIRDNAIYQLAQALLRVRDHTFPVHMSEVTRAYFARAGALQPGPLGKAMQAIAADPQDAAAAAIVSTDRTYNSMLRTTCVATLVEAGHAVNALPQRATATVNCRIFPGETEERVAAALNMAIDDPGVKLALINDNVRPVAVAPPLDSKVIGPMEVLAKRHFPGVPIIPTMSTGATDAAYLGVVGLPTYGVPGLWNGPDAGTHGLNERIPIQAIWRGRDYIYDLIKDYAGIK
jgi:acetylornithine deacetylase/succinyl-diaminopimelate desuccinylase-like protein